MSLETRIIYRDSAIDVVETVRISNGKAVLSEIPDAKAHVRISGYTEVYLEDTEFLKSNEFAVNYNNGIVHFSPKVSDGTYVTVSYKGKGYVMYPASRIYTEDSSGTLNTFKDIAEKVDELIKIINNSVAGVSSVNGRTGIVKITATDVGAVPSSLYNSDKLNSDTRISSLESRLANTNNTVATISKDIDKIKLDIAGTISNSQTIKLIQTDLTNLKNSSANADKEIVNLKLSNLNNVQRINENTLEIVNVKQSVTSVSEEVRKLKDSSSNSGVLAHKHKEADITDLDKYTKAQTDNLIDDKISKHNHDKDYAKVEHKHTHDDVTGLDEMVNRNITNSAFGKSIGKLIEMQQSGITGIPFVDLFYSNDEYSSSPLKRYSFSSEISEVVTRGVNKKIKVSTTEGLVVGMQVSIYSNTALVDTDSRITEIDKVNNTITLDQINSTYNVGDIITTFSAKYNGLEKSYTAGSKTTYTGYQKLDKVISGLSTICTRTITASDKSKLLAVLHVEEKPSLPKAYILNVYRKEDLPISEWVQIVSYKNTSSEYIDSFVLINNSSNVEVVFQSKNRVFGDIKLSSISFNPATAKIADTYTMALVSENTSKRIYKENFTSINSQNGMSFIARLDSSIETGKSDVIVLSKPELGSKWSEKIIHKTITQAKDIKIAEYKDNLIVTYLELDSFTKEYNYIYYSYFNGVIWSESKPLKKYDFNIEDYTCSIDKNGNISVYVLDKVNNLLHESKMNSLTNSSWGHSSRLMVAESISVTKDIGNNTVIVSKVNDEFKMYNLGEENVQEQFLNIPKRNYSIADIEVISSHNKMFLSPMIILTYSDGYVQVSGAEYVSKTDNALGTSIATFLLENNNISEFKNIYLTCLGMGEFSLDIAILGENGVQEYVKNVITNLDDKDKLFEASKKGNKMLLRFRFNERIEGIYGVIDNSVDFSSDISNIETKINALEISDKAQKEQMTQLFQSVSSGKRLVATAITDKGIVVATDASFSDMANAIALIVTGEKPPSVPTGIYAIQEYNGDVKISWNSTQYKGEEGTIEGFNIYINGVKENSLVIRNYEDNVLKFSYTIDKHRYQSICSTSFPKITITSVSKTKLESSHSKHLATLANGYTGVSGVSVKGVDVYYNRFNRPIVKWKWESSLDYYDEKTVGFMVKTYDKKSGKIIKLEYVGINEYYNENIDDCYHFEVMQDRKEEYRDLPLLVSVTKLKNNPYYESVESSKTEFGFYDIFGQVENLVVAQSEDEIHLDISWDIYTEFVASGYLLMIEYEFDGENYLSINGGSMVKNGVKPSISELDKNLLSPVENSLRISNLKNEIEYKITVQAVSSNPYNFSKPNEKIFLYSISNNVYNDMIFDSSTEGNSSIDLFKFSGDWILDELNGYFRAKPITNNQTSRTVLSMNLDEKYKVFGEYLVSTEGGYDFFDIDVNGVNIVHESGLKEGLFQFELDAGKNRRVSFSYSKDSDGYDNQDAVFIKNLYIIKESSPLLPKPVGEIQVTSEKEYVDIVFEALEKESSTDYVIELIDEETGYLLSTFNHSSEYDSVNYRIEKLIPNRRYQIKIYRVKEISGKKIYSTASSKAFKTLNFEDGTKVINVGVVTLNKNDARYTNFENNLKSIRGVYASGVNQADVDDKNLSQYDIIFVHDIDYDVNLYDTLKDYLTYGKKPFFITTKRYTYTSTTFHSDSFSAHLGIIDGDSQASYTDGYAYSLGGSNRINNKFKGRIQIHTSYRPYLDYGNSSEFIGEKLLQLSETQNQLLLGSVEAGTVNKYGEALNGHIVYAPVFQIWNKDVTDGLKGYLKRSIEWLMIEHEAPKKPVGLSSTLNPDGTIKINWTPNMEVDLDGYIVFLNGVQYTNIIKEAEFSIGGLIVDKSYKVEVLAVDKNGNESVKSNSINISVSFDVVPPKSPSQIEYVERDKMIELRWEKNIEFDFNGYNVYVDGKKHNTSIIKDNNYAIKGLTNNKTYLIEITSLDLSMIESVASKSLNVTPKPMKWTLKDEEYVMIHSKDNLKDRFKIYNKRSTDNTIYLSWDNSAYSSYLYFDKHDSNAKIISTTSTTTTSTVSVSVPAQGSLEIYMAEGVSSKFIRIYDANSFDELEFNNNPVFPNPTPKNLNIKEEDEKITFTWDASEETYWNHYNIYVNGVLDNYDGIKTNSYTTGLKNNNEEYDIVFKSVTKSLRESSAINSQSKTYKVTPRDTTSPFPINSETIKLVAGDKSVQISWSETNDGTRGSGVKGYNIYLNAKKINEELILENSYNIVNSELLTNGYRAGITISAVDMYNNESSRSDTKIFIPREDGWVEPCSDLIITGINFESAKVEWKANDLDFTVDRYEVSVYKNNELLKTYASTSKEVIITDLIETEEYKIEVVVARSIGGEIFKSNPVSTLFTTEEDPLMPKNAVLSYGKDFIKINWENVQSIAGYNVYVDGVKQNLSLIAVNTYTVTNLKEGQKYEVRVSSQKSNGEESSKTKPLFETPRGTTPPNPLLDFDLTPSYNSFYINLKQNGLYDRLDTYDYAPTQVQIDNFINNYNSSYNSRMYFLTYYRNGYKYLMVSKSASYDVDYEYYNNDYITPKQSTSSQYFSTLNELGVQNNNGNYNYGSMLPNSYTGVQYLDSRKYNVYAGTNIIPENVIGYNIYIDGVLYNEKPIDIKKDHYRVKVKGANKDILKEYNVEIKLVDKGGLESESCTKKYKTTKLRKNEVKIGVMLYNYSDTSSYVQNNYLFTDLTNTGWKWRYYIENTKPNFKNYDLIILSNWRDDDETRSWVNEAVNDGMPILIGRYYTANDGLLVEKLGLYEGNYVHRASTSEWYAKTTLNKRSNQYHPLMDSLPVEMSGYNKYYDYIDINKTVGHVIGHRKNYEYATTSLVVDEGITTLTGLETKGRMMFVGNFASNASYNWDESSSYQYGEKQWFNACLEWLAGKDVVLPAIPKNVVAKYGDETVTLSWDTVEDTDILGYNIYIDNNKWNIGHGSIIHDGTERMSVTLRTISENSKIKLENGVKYDFYIRAVDKWDNEGFKSETVTMSPKDMLPPTKPNKLRAIERASSIIFSWNHSPEDDLEGYNIYVNDVKHNNELVYKNVYEIKDIEVGIKQKIEIKAMDIDGNESDSLEPIFAESRVDEESYEIDFSLYDEKPREEDIRMFEIQNYDKHIYMLEINSALIKKLYLVAYEKQLTFTHNVNSPNLELVAQDIEGKDFKTLHILKQYDLEGNSIVDTSVRIDLGQSIHNGVSSYSLVKVLNVKPMPSRVVGLNSVFTWYETLNKGIAEVSWTASDVSQDVIGYNLYLDDELINTDGYIEGTNYTIDGKLERYRFKKLKIVAINKYHIRSEYSETVSGEHSNIPLTTGSVFETSVYETSNFGDYSMGNAVSFNQDIKIKSIDIYTYDTTSNRKFNPLVLEEGVFENIARNSKPIEEKDTGWIWTKLAIDKDVFLEKGKKYLIGFETVTGSGYYHYGNGNYSVINYNDSKGSKSITPTKQDRWNNVYYTTGYTAFFTQSIPDGKYDKSTWSYMSSRQGIRIIINFEIIEELHPVVKQ